MRAGLERGINAQGTQPNSSFSSASSALFDIILFNFCILLPRSYQDRLHREVNSVSTLIAGLISLVSPCASPLILMANQGQKSPLFTLHRPAKSSRQCANRGKRVAAGADWGQEKAGCGDSNDEVCCDDTYFCSRQTCGIGRGLIPASIAATSCNALLYYFCLGQRRCLPRWGIIVCNDMHPTRTYHQSTWWMQGHVIVLR